MAKEKREKEKDVGYCIYMRGLWTYVQYERKEPEIRLKSEEEDSSGPLRCLHLSSSSGSRLQTMGNLQRVLRGVAQPLRLSDRRPVGQRPCQTETPHSWSPVSKTLDWDNLKAALSG